MKEEYKEIYLPNHHRSKQNGCVDEHIIIAEKILGRKIKEKEVVHHIDNNKTNNNEDNLMIFVSSSDHIKYHKRDNPKIKEIEKNLFIVEDTNIATCMFCGNLFHSSINRKYFCSRKCFIEYNKNINIDPFCLAKSIYEVGFEGTGKIYNVTGTTIINWCKKLNMPCNKKDIVVWYKDKAGVVNRNKRPKIRSVHKIDPTTNNIICTYTSINIAAHSVGKKNGSHITEACKNGRKSYGYYWKYADNYN